MTLYAQWKEVERIRLALATSRHEPIFNAAFNDFTRQSIALQKAMGWRNIKTKVT